MGPYDVGSAVLAPECGDLRESGLEFTVVTAALRLRVVRAIAGLGRGALCGDRVLLGVVLVDVGALAGLVGGLLLCARVRLSPRYHTQRVLVRLCTR